MDIPTEHVTAAMETFRYTAREARFLWIVTAFSGHFLRAQWLHFAQADRGKAAQQLIDRLLENGHATGYVHGKALRYHVHSRPLYRVFERENSNHRRQCSNALVAQRLGGLDYVLAHLDARYLLTEAERTGHFQETHGVTDMTVLPQRTYAAPRASGRPAASVYFPDRFPLSAAGSETRFTFVDAPADSLLPFGTHVRMYSPLFTALRNPWRFTFISGKPYKLRGAEDTFRRALTAPAPEDALPPDLRRYFELELRWERKDWGTNRKALIDERGRLAARYADPKYRRRYEEWRHSTADPLPLTTTPGAGNPTTHLAGFETFEAPSLAR